MRQYFLAALLLASCDDYNPSTSFGGDTVGDNPWDDPIPALSPGEDPCAVIAQNTELALVDSTPLVAGGESEFLLAPNGASASADAVKWVSDGFIGHWDMAPYGLKDARPILAYLTEIQNPEENPVREGSRVTIWAATSGPAKLRQRHSGQYAPPSQEWDFVPYGSAGGDYKIAAVDVGLIDPYNFGGQWVIDAFPPVAKVLGAVRVGAGSTTKASPAGAGTGGQYLLTVWDDAYRWLPYGGICYLAPSSGMDGGTGG
jgi:hypothetical protein